MSDFLCTECGKALKSGDDLDLHYHNAHDKTPFTCEQCDIQCIGRQQFNNHKRKHKVKNSKVFKCKVCQYEVRDSGNFYKHVKLHTVVKEKKAKPKISRSCEPCGKTFDRKDNFDRHVKSHSRERILRYVILKKLTDISTTKRAAHHMPGCSIEAQFTLTL